MDILWETYLTPRLINSNGLQLLRRYDHHLENMQAALLEENGVAYIRVFVDILRDISKQETRKLCWRDGRDLGMCKIQQSLKLQGWNDEVLHICIKLLDNSRDPKTLAVTCNDIAEFIQIHPAGRGIILDLKGKERVMNHPNPQTAKQALLCVQNVLLGAKNAIYIKQSIFL
uniref:ATPase V1 complex subunit H C-terminal domain-containing protein n=1 Tax=Physcomitrium patens TaxID=3218 RepID=A0A2K1L289_PHYPA|nr:hypothetical protein PHYPA_002935 [Physcomitrium patens]